MCVHHLGKGDRTGGDAILGSTALFGAVDTALLMKCRNEQRVIESVQRYGTDFPETVVVLDPDTGIVWNKTRVTKTPSGKKTHEHRPESEHLVLCTGTYPALIDPATFDMVQGLLESHRQDVVAFRTRRNPEVGLLRGGLARCEVCGSLLAVGRNRDDTVYRCRHDRKTAGVCTGGGIIPVDVLDGAAWAYLANVLTDPARILAHLEQLRRDDPTAADVAMLDRHQADLERQLASFTAAIAKLIDNPHALDELVAGLDAVGKQLAATARQRQDVLARQAAWQANIAELADLEARCREVEAAVALATDYADRRALLHIMRVQADLYPINAPERWVITSGVVAEVATNLSSTSSATQRAATTSWATSSM